MYYTKGWSQAFYGSTRLGSKPSYGLDSLERFALISPSLDFCGILQLIQQSNPYKGFFCVVLPCVDGRNLTAGHKGNTTEYCGASRFGNDAERRTILNDCAELESPSWVTANNPITRCDARLQLASEHSKRVASRKSDEKSTFWGFYAYHSLLHSHLLAINMNNTKKKAIQLPPIEYEEWKKQQKPKKRHKHSAKYIKSVFNHK